MNDISIFVKELKGRFAQWYNRRHGRYETLWAERFKSLLLEGGRAVATVAAYIDLNPVRASLCADPKDYNQGGPKIFFCRTHRKTKRRIPPKRPASARKYSYPPF